jgi:hypothetical protein
MADLRSEKKNVGQERRKDPRLEFHCNAMVLGLDGVKTITDISLKRMRFACVLNILKIHFLQNANNTAKKMKLLCIMIHP